MINLKMKMLNSFILNKLVKTMSFITILLMALKTGAEAKDDTAQCQQFNPVFLWYTGTGEDSSFFLHRRLLITFISELPENTSVSILTFGAENNITSKFKIQTGNKSWVDRITTYKPGKTLNHALSDNIIHQAFSNHYSSHAKNKADIVYILVNDKTEENVIKTVSDVLRKKKTFIIMSGNKAEDRRTKVWLKLATNDQHFVEFYRDEDIEKTTEAILVLSCQDAKFVCDTDMFWSNEDGGCLNCTYICSSSCNEQSDLCTETCPFFHQVRLNKQDGHKPLEHENIRWNDSYGSGSIVIISFLLLFLTILVVYKRSKKTYQTYDSA